MDYSHKDDTEAWATLADPGRAYVARYALGRDYHKLMRNRLQKLATQINDEVAPLGYRVFVDSAPCWSAHWPATPVSAGSANTPA